MDHGSNCFIYNGYYQKFHQVKKVHDSDGGGTAFQGGAIAPPSSAFYVDPPMCITMNFKIKKSTKNPF